MSHITFNINGFLFSCSWQSSVINLLFRHYLLQGFTYPDEVGYPLDSRQAKYYLMETHYSNPNPDFTKLHARQMVDNSGLKIYFTHMVRRNDAGVLSIGEYRTCSAVCTYFIVRTAFITYLR